MSDVPSPPAATPKNSSGKIVILAIFAVGISAGLFASIYWSQPEHAVAGSFAQIHTLLMRGPKKDALRLLAPSVTLDGRAMPAADFLETYAMPANADRVEVAPCGSVPAHWVLTMRERRYCFFREGKTWKLHWVENAACTCR